MSFSILLELNEEIAYTMNKHINNYTAKDYWIRFLGNSGKKHYAREMRE
ncbi:MAG: hypothetical protein P1P64_00880 [Treponemataceae bacterium]